MQESGIRQHPGTRGYGSDTWTLHIDSTHTHCQFKTAKSEDNFGWYGDGMSNKFRRTQEDQSTTQWWFGAHLLSV